MLIRTCWVLACAVVLSLCAVPASTDVHVIMDGRIIATTPKLICECPHSTETDCQCEWWDEDWPYCSFENLPSYITETEDYYVFAPGVAPDTDPLRFDLMSLGPYEVRILKTACE